MTDHRKNFFTHSDGRFIHPNAPAGGCGPGFSTLHGPQIGHVSAQQLPHPDSPAGRVLHHHEMKEAQSHHFPINAPKSEKVAAIPKTVRRGDQGEDVQKLQRLLNAHLTPSPSLKIDGLFGLLTEQAVQQYQKGVSITVDGLVGKQTWFYLLKADKAKYVQPVQNAPNIGASKLITPSSAALPTTSIPPPKPVNTFTRPNTISNAHTGIWEWSMKDKFIDVLRRTKEKLPTSMQQEFSQLISKESLGMMAGTLVVWAGSHAFGVGEIVDIGLIGVGIYYLGRAAFQVIDDLKDFLVITSIAKDENDLNDAASHLAKAISIIGVVAFVALLTKVAVKGLAKAKSSKAEAFSRENTETISTGTPRKPKQLGNDPINKEISQNIKEVAKSTPKVPTLKYPVQTAPNEAFFWSGRTGGVGGESYARSIAKLNNGTTLEALIERRGIEMPKWNPEDPNVVKAWKDISADYASGSSGTVRAVIGADLRSGNVWEASELPALKANPNVDKIVTIDPLSGVENVIFERN